jgi:hypothetical protein
MSAQQQQPAEAGQPRLGSDDEEMVALRHSAEKVKKEVEKKRLREEVKRDEAYLNQDAEIVISAKPRRV